MKRKETLVKKSIFKESIEYLLESWPFILTVTALFFFAAFIGFAFSGELGFLDKVIRELIEKTSGLEGLPLTLFIFFNNLSSAFYGLLLGVFLGIMPVFSSFGNGLLLGYVAHKVVESGGGFFELVSLVPHGVFELPAIFISLGLGLRLGMSVFSRPFWKTLSRRFVLSFISFLVVVMPLLVVAAVIEGSFISLNSGEYSVCFESNCFSVDLAISELEMTTGLSERASLENGTGMLFIFNESGRYNFWMKDMQFPLDIIWLNETKNIVYVWENALPCSGECIEVSSELPAKYVLEIPSGSYKELGLNIGDSAKFSDSKHLKLSSAE